MAEDRQFAGRQWLAGIGLVLAPLAVAACAATTGASSPSPRAQSSATPSVVQAGSIDELRKRALQPPASSANCPSVAPQQTLKPTLATGLAPGKPPVGPNYGYGDGPVYLSGQVTFYPGAWDLAIWMVKPPYQGALLIRGQQVNGSGKASFSQQMDEYGKQVGSPPGRPATTVTAYGMSVPFYDELDLPTGSQPPSWAAYFGDTHFDTAGCYFIQVDGSTFTEVFLLEVPDAARPPA